MMMRNPSRLVSSTILVSLFLTFFGRLQKKVRFEDEIDARSPTPFPWSLTPPKEDPATQEPAPTVVPPLPAVEPPSLPIMNPTKCQAAAIEAICKGWNAMITGSAGTGKSFILNTVKRRLGTRHMLHLSAMTGMAARVIGGTTLHSFLGINVGNIKTDTDAWNMAKKHKGTIQRIAAVQTLIVDESELV
jgi:ATP-dependent DNA helicase PIF1